MIRGEVWLINLEPTIGAEIKKTRPCVIVNDDLTGILPLKIIVPFTDWKEHYDIVPWMVKVEPDKQNGLHKTSGADTFQVRSVAQERFIQKTGKLSDEKIREITLALALVLNIEL